MDLVFFFFEKKKKKKILMNTITTKFEREKCNWSNFSLWKPKIKTILKKDNCLMEIEGKPTILSDEK